MGPHPMTFDEAEAYCVSKGGHLATIKGSDDRDEAKALCKTYDGVDSRGCWIGLYHDDASSKWKWIDGSDIDYAFDLNGNPLTGNDPWWTGEPNHDTEDCIHIFEGQSFNWNDILCSDKNHPICYGMFSYIIIHL